MEVNKIRLDICYLLNQLWFTEHISREDRSLCHDLFEMFVRYDNEEMYDLMIIINSEDVLTPKIRYTCCNNLTKFIMELADKIIEEKDLEP